MTKKLTLRESHPPYTLSIEEEDVLGQEPIILERDGQPVAAIVPLAEYDAFQAWQEVHFAHETPSPEEILRGELIGDADILIAATALEHGLAIATGNIVHFERIPGLQVVNWRELS
jgi:antitoxin (DNA-binding transcriptional repressor) of toxin-antitoxin stability system